jgi:arylsulfatase A-like enzyme
MNVLVVSLPGLRLSHLGCYGNEWVATPAFDRLAANAVVFDRHYADCPGAPHRLRPEWTGHFQYDFPDAARNPVVPPGRSLRQILEDERSVFCDFPEDTSRPTRGGSVPWDEAFDHLVGRLEEMPEDRPWCVWEQGLSLAPPWGLPEDVLTAYLDEDDDVVPWTGTTCGLLGTDEDDSLLLQLSYAAVLTHVDGVIESFLDRLEALPAFADSLFILTSGRGLALGEHGFVGDYRPWLHDELIHLPFLMRLPGGAQAGRRIPALTQPIDLYATVLEAFGLHDAGDASQSLLPLAYGRTRGTREFACTSLRTGESLEWSIRTRDWAFLLPLLVPSGDPPRSAQLYAKPEDAWEVNNVRDRHLEFTEHLEHQLRTHIEGIPPRSNP